VNDEKDEWKKEQVPGLENSHEITWHIPLRS
jgi:hypothetical protein